METLTVVLLVVVAILSGIAAGVSLAIWRRPNASGGASEVQITQLRQQLAVLEQASGARAIELQQVLDMRLAGIASRNSEDAALRARTDSAIREELQSTLNQRLAQVEARIVELTRNQNVGLHQLRSDNAAELEKIRVSNEDHLEKMRATVDEKLQGTLEKRLGESFELVSKRLEQVQRGLGEMQTLANDVGGLKKVLSNVKTRGAWGEVQLSRQL